MVSFWPFKAEDRSAAAFEKVLSSLTKRINKVNAKEVSFRQTHRRLRVLWTLYAGAIYVIIVLILTLITGPSTWSATEGASIIFGPFVIYGVRLVINTYYNFRIGKCQRHLEGLSQEREETISRLKDATKYNSTQELLQKYGGSNDTSGKEGTPSKSQRDKGLPAKRRAERTGMLPPPTANIPHRDERTAPGSPVSPSPDPPLGSPAQIDDSAEFAPNAFDEPRLSVSAPTSPVQSPYPPSQHTWIDRILDLVMGEDETQPKNRLALICQGCRLVNGQAPPGTRSLDEVGKWRCMACGHLNGTESVGDKMLREMATKIERDRESEPAVGQSEDSVDGVDEAVSSARADTGTKARQRKRSER